MSQLRRALPPVPPSQARNFTPQCKRHAMLPKVVRGTHPIHKEKVRAEKKALGKRLKGEKPDDAAERLKKAEAGKAGKKKAKAK